MSLADLNPEVREFLGEVCREEGYETINERSIESLIVESEEVYSEVTGKHRWYFDATKVVQIKDKFIMYDTYEVTGDMGIGDMGLNFDFSTVYFCEPYQETVTKYRIL